MLNLETIFIIASNNAIDFGGTQEVPGHRLGLVPNYWDKKAESRTSSGGAYKSQDMAEHDSNEAIDIIGLQAEVVNGELVFNFKP
jgi:hypothetical protein